MVVMIAVGLFAQTLALILLFHRLRRTWLTHVGAIFVVLAVIYHGVNEIILWMFPGYDPYRRLVATDYVGQFVMIVGVAILLFTLSYLIAVRHESGHLARQVMDQERSELAGYFDWKIMIFTSIPMVLLTVQGQGYQVGTTGDSAHVAVGVTNQYFLIAAVLASLALVARFGRRALVPVLLGQSVLIAAVGQRAEIVIAAVLLLHGLARMSVRMRREQALLGIAILTMLMLAITANRGDSGRLAAGSDAGGRVQYLVAGVANLGAPLAWQQLAADLGYRLDGNGFGAMELQAFANGAESLGLAPLMNDVLLAVPGPLNPEKTSSPLEARSDKLYAEQHLGLFGLQLAPGVWLDILPTQLGSITGLAGPWGLGAGSLLLGLAFGLGDRWLLRRLSPPRVLIGLGLLYGVMFYERSWDVYAISFRGTILLVLVLSALHRIRAYVYRRPFHIRPPSPR